METVRIQMEPCDENPTGVVVINKVDFDPERHVLVAEKVEKPQNVPGAKLNFSTMSNADMRAALSTAKIDDMPAKNRGDLIELCKANADAINAAVNPGAAQ